MQDFYVIGVHCDIDDHWCETKNKPLPFCMNNGTCVPIPQSFLRTSIQCQCDDTEFSGKICSSFDALKSTMLTFRTLRNVANGLVNNGLVNESSLYGIFFFSSYL